MSVTLEARPDEASPELRARARRPLRVAIAWQTGVTAVIAAIAAALAGMSGAVSALLGGAVCAVPFALAGWIATRRMASSAVSMVTGALWAEMVRVVLIVLFLGATLLFYPGLIAAAFFAAFIAGIVILSLAVFIRDSAASTESAH